MKDAEEIQFYVSCTTSNKPTTNFEFSRTIKVVRDVNFDVTTNAKPLVVATGSQLILEAQLSNTGQTPIGAKCSLTLPNDKLSFVKEKDSICQEEEEEEEDKVVCTVANLSPEERLKLKFDTDSASRFESFNLSMICHPEDDLEDQKEVVFEVTLEPKADLTFKQLVNAKDDAQPIVPAAPFSLSAQVANSGPSDTLQVNCSIQLDAHIAMQLNLTEPSALSMSALTNKTLCTKSNDYKHDYTLLCKLGDLKVNDKVDIDLFFNIVENWRLDKVNVTTLESAIKCVSNSPQVNASAALNLLVKPPEATDKPTDKPTDDNKDKPNNDNDKAPSEGMTSSQMYLIIFVVVTIAAVVVIAMWWRNRQERQGWGLPTSTNGPSPKSPSLNRFTEMEKMMARDRHHLED